MLPFESIYQLFHRSYSNKHIYSIQASRLATTANELTILDQTKVKNDEVVTNEAVVLAAAVAAIARQEMLAGTNSQKVPLS